MKTAGTIRSMLAVALLAATSLAAAGDPVTARAPRAFDRQAAVVKEDLKPGGQYDSLSAQDRTRALDLLERIGNRLHRAGSVDAMSENDRVALFNDQGELNGLLRGSAGSELVCEKGQVTGSRLTSTTCLSAAQREEWKREHSEALRDSTQRRGGTPTATYDAAAGGLRGR